MDYRVILFSIIIGFVIGFVTNKIALMMLFHPRKKFFGIQGIVPKRKNKLAENISKNIHFILPKEYMKLISIPVVGTLIESKIREGVASTINKMPDDELEKLVRNIVKNELFFIEILGGILGALIGLIQGVVIGIL